MKPVILKSPLPLIVAVSNGQWVLSRWDTSKGTVLGAGFQKGGENNVSTHQINITAAYRLPEEFETAMTNGFIPLSGDSTVATLVDAAIAQGYIGYR
jgi:hypothetical protein